MSTSSSIDFKLTTKVISIGGVLDALKKLGWSCLHGKYVEFLPLHDDGDFFWQREAMKHDELLNLLEKKRREGELIGLIIRHQEDFTGGELLIRPEGDVSLLISINRKKVSEEVTLTDVSWYLKNFAPVFTEIGVLVESVSWSEHA